jgi:hypothetical protein
VVPAVWCVSFSQLVTFTIYEKDWYEEDDRFCSHCGEAMMSAFPSINRENGRVLGACLSCQWKNEPD